MDFGGRGTGWYSRWWSTLTTIAVLYLCLQSCSDNLCNCQVIPQETMDEYELRTPEEWRENWLLDSLYTCVGPQLQRLGELACMNDPRKSVVVKRSNSGREIFLPAKLAKAFLHYRHRHDSRRRRTGKDEECCLESNGCHLEELGEYCTLHSRAYHVSGSQP